MARVLLIVPVAHCSRYSGSGQRTFHLYRALAERHRLDVLLVPEYRSAVMVDLYPAWFEERFPEAGRLFLAPSAAAPAGGPASRPGRLAQLQARMRNALTSPAALCAVDGASADFVRQLVRREGYDLLAGRYLAPVARSGALNVADVPVLLDVDDRDDKVVESRIASPTTPALLKPLLRRHLVEVRAVAERLYARCAHLWLASEADLPDMRHPSRSVLRNIPYEPQGHGEAGTPHRARVVEDSRICLFVGSTHRMNREGVQHFVQRGWPQVRAAVPDARLRIVGSGGWERFKPRLEQFAGVEVIGAVDDLASEYERARFSVIPVFEGAGTKIKVLESLRHGRTVAAHSHAIRGFDELTHMQSLLEGDSHEGIAQACIALFQDAGLAHRLAANGARIVAQSYSFAGFGRTVAADVDAVLARSARGDVRCTLEQAQREDAS